jgi:hypothetical protein
MSADIALRSARIGSHREECRSPAGSAEGRIRRPFAIDPEVKLPARSASQLDRCGAQQSTGVSMSMVVITHSSARALSNIKKLKVDVL